MLLQDRVAVITGAAEGIGLACALLFHRQGARLILNDLEPLPSQLAAEDIEFVRGDCSLAEVQDQIGARSRERYGRVDVLVNNAGIGMYAEATASDIDKARRIFDVNVFAPVGMTQRLLPMLEASRGVIINICSVGAFASLPWSTFYCASKYALDALSEGMRRELASRNVAVVTVYPGIVRTRFRDHVLAGSAPPLVAGIQRIVEPERIAAAVLRAVGTRQRAVVVPPIGHAFRLLNRWMPWLMDRYLSRLHSPAGIRPGGPGSLG